MRIVIAGFSYVMILLKRACLSVFLIFTYSFGYAQTLQLKFDHISSENGLPQNTVNAIAKDKFGFMWFGTEAGLCRYDGYRFITYRYKSGDPNSINSNKITNINLDNQGYLWVETFGTEQLCRYNYERDNFDRISRNKVSASFLRKMQIGSANYQSGKFFYGSYRWQLDRRKNALVQTYLPTNRATIYTANAASRWSLNEPYVSRIFIDNDNILWVGTYSNGINKADLNAKPFHYFYHDPQKTNSVADNSIGAFCEDLNGNLWIGTRFKGISILRNDHTFEHYEQKEPGHGNLTNNKIRVLFCGSNGNMWIGAKSGLDEFDPKTHRFIQHTEGGLNNSGVYGIAESSPGQIWFATWKGIYGYDISRKAIYMADSTSLGTHRLKAICVDHKNQLWVGTEGAGVGVFAINKSGTLRLVARFRHNEAQPGSITDDRITSVFEDSTGNIWLGTSDGLNKYESESSGFHHLYASQNGLSDNTIAAITEDDAGCIWVSHKRGISQVNKTNYQVHNYSLIDGLQSNEFSDGAVLKSRFNKMLYFGGSNGYNAFHPDSIKFEKTWPEVVLTELQILNKPVAINAEVNGQILLHKPLYLTDKIDLNYRDKSIAIEFAGLHYANPSGNRYAYMLEGFDKDWVYVDASRRLAVYSNLSPGNYTFKVKAANSDGIWNPKPQLLHIHVSAAPWLSWWAYLLYSILIFSLLAIFYIYSLRYDRLRNKLQYETIIRSKENELHENKINFFTNISHEIKTPLSLILSPLEQLVKLANSSERVHRELETMQRNGNRLLRLVNQLLDLRRLETGKSEINIQSTEFKQLAERVVASFMPLAKQRSIDFNTDFAKCPQSWNLDAEKIEHVLYNLLSNAFKFTKDGGKISLCASEIWAKGEHLLSVDITDDGKGIDPPDFEKIFLPFEQGSVKSQGGTGLGLAYVKALVDLHQGTISVDSHKEADKNITIFSVLLPMLPVISEDFTPEGPAVKVLFDELGELTENEIGLNADQLLIDGKLPKLLLVEDNHEMREYLRLQFMETYVVIEAGDGIHGIAIATSENPDIIVSDVAMPEMDGFEMTRRLKIDPMTSHIPIILLTAKSPVEDQIEGLANGADDYVTKPFHTTLLALKIKNILLSRETLKRKYRGTISVGLSDFNAVSPDEKMLQKLFMIINERLSDNTLNGDEIGDELGMSRTHLYRKLKSLTGFGVSELIKEVRLKKAEQMLSEKKFNVNEVAFMTGFGDTDNFRRSFKTRFGVTPSSYLTKE